MQNPSFNGLIPMRVPTISRMLQGLNKHWGGSPEAISMHLLFPGIMIALLASIWTGHIPPDRWRGVLILACIYPLVLAGVRWNFAEEQRRIERIRSRLREKRCHRCSGPLTEWDGKLHDGQVHFNPGGYLPMAIVRCERCEEERFYYVSHDGGLFNWSMTLDEIAAEQAKRAHST